MARRHAMVYMIRSPKGRCMTGTLSTFAVDAWKKAIGKQGHTPDGMTVAVRNMKKRGFSLVRLREVDDSQPSATGPCAPEATEN